GAADEIAFDIVEIARRAPAVRQRRAAEFRAVRIEIREQLDRMTKVAVFVRGATDGEIDLERPTRGRAQRCGGELCGKLVVLVLAIGRVLRRVVLDDDEFRKAARASTRAHA